MRRNPYDPIAELAKRTKQKRARQALAPHLDAEGDEGS